MISVSYYRQSNIHRIV
uniref:Uncharacterized protein n=1 Tax=Rhizophora mucronata TaxID=61149 RepID=A0A2P2LP41_RHIMU